MDNSNFEPKTPFEGYVKAKIEDIQNDIKKLPCVETFKRLNKCETDIANIKGKTTVWGAITGFMAGIISRVIWRE